MPGLIDGDTPMDALLAVYDFIQMHTGDPGAAGTANVATETDRAAVVWGASSGGTASNSAVASFTGVAATETWTHFTAWDASSAGNCGFSGTVSNGSVVLGADVDFEIGDLDVTFPVTS